MSNDTPEFLKRVPKRLKELLGSKAAQLLSVWFTVAGYWNPGGLSRVTTFSSLGIIKKKADAADINLVMSMSHYLTDQEEVPSVDVLISSLISDEIPGDAFPCIEITVRNTKDGDHVFAFHAGTWMEI